jgi:hypothetical protein
MPGLSTGHAVPMAQYPTLHVGPQMPLTQKAAGDQVGLFGVTPEGQAIAGVVAPAHGVQVIQAHLELMDPGTDHGDARQDR